MGVVYQYVIVYRYDLHTRHWRRTLMLFYIDMIYIQNIGVVYQYAIISICDNILIYDASVLYANNIDIQYVGFCLNL